MRFTVAILIAVVATFVPTAQGATFYWIGGTTNFSDTRNWVNGKAPTDPNNIPCSTTFGGPNANIYSQLAESTTYYVGSALYLPLNGVLRLATDGTVIAFTDPMQLPSYCNATATSVNAVWNGGLRPNTLNDFNCHKNWRINDPSPLIGTDAQSPPCSDDAIFEGTATYSVYVPNDVSIVVLNSIRLGNLILRNPSDSLTTLLPQVNLVQTSATVSIGNPRVFTQLCQPTLNYVGTQCVCYSSCPTDAMLTFENNNYQKNLNALTQQQITAQNAIGLYFFRGTFSSAALSSTTAILSSNFNDLTQRAALVSALNSAIATNLPTNGSLAVTSLSLSGDTLTVSGSLFAAAIFMTPPGSSSPPTTSAANPLTFTQTSPTANGTRLQSTIVTTLTPLLLNYFNQQLQTQINNTINSLPPAGQTALNTLTSTPNATQLLNTVNNDPCFATCGTTVNCSECVANVTATLVSQGVDPTVANNAANNLADAKNDIVNSGGNWNNFTSTATTVVNQTQQSNSISTAQQQATPQIYNFTSPPFFVGQNPRVSGDILTPQQLRTVMPNNIQNFLNLITNVVNGARAFRSVYNVQAMWTPNAASYGPSARRRRGLNTASAIVVTFQYQISCLPTTPQAQCMLMPNTGSYTSLNNLISSAYNNMTSNFAAGFCQTFPPNSALPVFDYTCIQNYASTTCQAQTPSLGVDAARAFVNNSIYTRIVCGLYPTYPNGSCYDTTYAAFAALNASAFAASAVCSNSGGSGSGGSGGTGASSGGGGGGGGGGLGLAAAGAGGGVAIIVIIIVIIVVRRRRNNSPGNRSKSRSDDRTVVAFENPMYDDPSMGRENTMPVYDNNAKHDSEGLYDEPAFNQGKVSKQNPVYQSNEDLTAGGAGYLESEGKVGGGDGYLDVSPGQVMAEDTGYLESKELAPKPAAAAAAADPEPQATYEPPPEHTYGSADNFDGGEEYAAAE